MLASSSVDEQYIFMAHVCQCQTCKLQIMYIYERQIYERGLDQSTDNVIPYQTLETTSGLYISDSDVICLPHFLS